MAKKGQNIYKRKDGRWEGRYVKSYDINGKPVRGYIYGKTFKETKEKLEICKQDVENNQKIISSSMLYSEWLEDWIKSQKLIKGTTRMQYNSFLKNHIKDSIGKVMLKKLNADILQNFIDDESAKYSAKTVKSVFSLVRSSLDSARRKNFVYNIYGDIKLPKTKQKPVKILTKEEQKRFETVLLKGENRVDIGIFICLYTGIRIGELCALTWDKINFKNNTILIDKTAQRIENNDIKTFEKTKINFDTPKSLSSIRTIPIPNFLIEELEKYRKEQGHILRDNGRYLDVRNVTTRFKKVLKLAEVDDIKFHALRHTFATRALELGFDIKTLSEILGHSNVTLTLNLYAHSLPEHKKKEMDKFESLFNK